MEEIFTIEYYEAESGKCPYIDWEGKLQKIIRAQVRKRLNRLRLGNFGDCKPIKGEQGVYELRIHIGPGYRIYYGAQEKKIIVLLCGGDKDSQDTDIIKAGKYWRDCLETFKG